MNITWSFQILQLVNQHIGESAEESINRAKIYREFVEGKKEEEIPQVAVEHPVEPGARRKRRTKAEMETASLDKQNTGFDHPKYEHLQQAMMRLFDKEFGMDAAREILDSFGVKSISELKPEQYQGFLVFLQEALNGKPLV